MSLKPPIPKPLLDTLEKFSGETKENFAASDFAKRDPPISIDFLKQYDGNKATFESYRREVERLLQWSWLITKKSILKLQRQEIETYIQFCLKPPNLGLVLSVRIAIMAPVCCNRD